MHKNVKFLFENIGHEKHNKGRIESVNRGIQNTIMLIIYVQFTNL